MSSSFFSNNWGVCTPLRESACRRGRSPQVNHLMVLIISRGWQIPIQCAVFCYGVIFDFLQDRMFTSTGDSIAIERPRVSTSVKPRTHLTSSYSESCVFVTSLLKTLKLKFLVLSFRLGYFLSYSPHTLLQAISFSMIITPPQIWGSLGSTTCVVFSYRKWPCVWTYFLDMDHTLRAWTAEPLLSI